MEKPFFINLEPRSVRTSQNERAPKQQSVEILPKKKTAKPETPALDKESILLLLKDLLEKKKAGKLNELDKKLLNKLQQIVSENPQQYGSKVAYL